MNKNKIYIILITLIILLLAGVYVYLLFFAGQGGDPSLDNEDNGAVSGFTPLNTDNLAEETNKEDDTGPSFGTKLPTLFENLPKLRQISTEPVSGAVASSTSSTTIIRFTDKATGHTLEANSSNNGIIKITNTTIPKIHETVWSKNGTGLISRYTNLNSPSIQTYLASIENKISTSTQEYTINGLFLDVGISSIVFSPKADSVFYIKSTSNGAEGYILNTKNLKSVQVFQSPVKNWIAEWPEENTISLTSPSSYYATGQTYHLNTKTNTLSKVLGNISGLTSLTSKDTKKIFYSLSTKTNFNSGLYTIKDDKYESAPFRTLPEKCVWSKMHPEEIYCAVSTYIKAGIYPDDWYQGLMSFDDQIWRWNTETGAVTLLVDLEKESGFLIDAFNLSLDQDENNLIFMDKVSLQLWSLKI
jgi:hypothetical protein